MGSLTSLTDKSIIMHTDTDRIKRPYHKSSQSLDLDLDIGSNEGKLFNQSTMIQSKQLHLSSKVPCMMKASPPMVQVALWEMMLSLMITITKEVS